MFYIFHEYAGAGLVKSFSGHFFPSALIIEPGVRFPARGSLFEVFHQIVYLQFYKRKLIKLNAIIWDLIVIQE